MIEILNTIQDFIDWYMSTSLPKDTATAFYNIMVQSFETLKPLITEYITIMFG